MSGPPYQPSAPSSPPPARTSTSTATGSPRTSDLRHDSAVLSTSGRHLVPILASPEKPRKRDPRSVCFNETVIVASLPVEEQKDALHARRGPWTTAPLVDELWDGERRMFWEKELSLEDLREVLRFRRIARYAGMVQNLNSTLRINLPVPKPPPACDDLVKASLELSPLGYEYNDKLREIFGYYPPADRKSAPGSPNKSSPDSPEAKKPRADPKAIDAKISLSDLPASSRSPVERKASSDRLPEPDAKHISLSQIAARNADKAGRASAPADQANIAAHRRSGAVLKARKRRSPLLQPWFVVLYFFSPLLLLGLAHWIPWFRNVFVPAYWENRAIRTALEVPYFMERLLHLPDAPILKSTVYIGIFAVEVTTIAYLFFLLLSNIMVVVILRPLIVSLSLPNAHHHD